MRYQTFPLVTLLLTAWAFCAAGNRVIVALNLSLRCSTLPRADIVPVSAQKQMQRMKMLRCGTGEGYR